MYKQSTAWITAIVLVIGSTAATADRKGHQYEKHHNHKRWQPPAHRVTQIHKHYRSDYPGYLGAALLGSAITYTLFHQHSGADCRDNHGYRDTRDFRGRYSNRYDVVGCHRIERFADGSERRIRVPLTQCH